MKTAGLIIGVGLMLLSGITFVVFLAMPSITNDRVNFQEAALGLIPSALIFLLSLALTVVSLIFVMKAKKNSVNQN